MALYADRVKDSASVTGTGAITLSGTAPTGFQSFATAFGASPQTVAYCIADQTGNNWEVGTGVFNGTTGLTRVTVLGSSNGGSLVNFTGGTQDVFCTAPAAYLLPPGANTQVAYNDAGLPGASANFTYVSGTNTVSFGNITGSALGMTIQPLAPTSGAAGALALQARNAASGNSNGGRVTLNSGNSAGTGVAGDITFQSGSSPDSNGTLFVVGGGSLGLGGGISCGSGYSEFGTGGDFLFYLGGGGVDDGNMYFQDSGSSNFIHCKTATSGGALQLGFFNATPVSRPQPTSSGAGGAIGVVTTALNSLGLIDSGLIVAPTELFGGLIDTIPYGDGGGGFFSDSKFKYVSSTNTLTIGSAGNNVNSTITTVTPTGSLATGILRLLGTNASATSGFGGGVTITTGNGTGTNRGGNFILTSGNGGLTGSTYTGVGGNITMTSGVGRIGGNFTMTAGTGNVTNGGSFAMSAGSGNTNGGSFTLTGGFGQSNGGSVEISSGTTFSGASGDVAVRSGQGGSSNGTLNLQNGTILAKWSGGGDDPTVNELGFYQTTPVGKQTVSGSRASGAALESLLLALSNMGLITDSTSA